MPVYWFWQNLSKITTAYLNSGGCHQHLQIVPCMCLPILFHDCLEVSSCVVCLPWNEVRVCLEANACGMSNRLSCALLGEKCTCVVSCVYSHALGLCTFKGVWLKGAQRPVFFIRKRAHVAKTRHGSFLVFSCRQPLGISHLKVCMSRWQGATMAVRRC